MTDLSNDLYNETKEYIINEILTEDMKSILFGSLLYNLKSTKLGIMDNIIFYIIQAYEVAGLECNTQELNKFEVLQLSKSTLKRSINSLVENGYILKVTKSKRGVVFKVNHEKMTSRDVVNCENCVKISKNRVQNEPYFFEDRVQNEPHLKNRVQNEPYLCENCVKISKNRVQNEPYFKNRGQNEPYFEDDFTQLSQFYGRGKLTVTLG